MKRQFCSTGRVLGWALLMGVLMITSGRAATVSVNIVDFSFQPSSVTIQVGDTVTWTQMDSIGHTSTSDAGLWASPLLSINQTFSRMFDTAGTYPYHCSPHPFMKASVTVEAATANQPPTVRITSPADGASVTDPNVTLQAEASDPDGTISKVEFFSGRTLLGTATSRPYQVTTTFTSGAQRVTAQATDNQGLTASSAVVVINVSAAVPTAPTLSGAKMNSGKFEFTVQGTVGQTYLVQASSDAKTWDTVQTIPAIGNNFSVTDTPDATLGHRFYRVQLKP